MPSYRPELSSMADDYANHALSQRAAFEATHPAALATARQLLEDPDAVVQGNRVLHVRYRVRRAPR